MARMLSALADDPLLGQPYIDIGLALEKWRAICSPSGGGLEQDWAEHDRAPSATTAYQVEDGQVQVLATAAARKGIQPLVTLAVNGGVRADVSVGQEVTFTGTIEVPPGAGSVVAAEWDFDGSGDFPVASRLSGSARTRGTVTVTQTRRFTQPGTYCPALRGVSQRDGDAKTPYARIQNLGRVRVVVQ